VAVCCSVAKTTTQTHCIKRLKKGALYSTKRVIERASYLSSKRYQISCHPKALYATWQLPLLWGTSLTLINRVLKQRKLHSSERDPLFCHEMSPAFYFKMPILSMDLSDRWRRCSSEESSKEAYILLKETNHWLILGNFANKRHSVVTNGVNRDSQGNLHSEWRDQLFSRKLCRQAASICHKWYQQIQQKRSIFYWQLNPTR